MALYLKSIYLVCNPVIPILGTYPEEILKSTFTKKVRQNRDRNKHSPNLETTQMTINRKMDKQIDCNTVILCNTTQQQKEANCLYIKQG